MPSMIQPSFASGELAPSLYARVDLARYQTGLRLCRNFIVMPYGGIKNRPGTVFISSTKGNGASRLIPFEFNDQQTYVLEFSHLCVRVYQGGGIVLNESGPDVGQPFELVTPYTEAELFELNYTQSADVMTLVHPAHPPAQLSRLANDDWTLADISFVPSIVAPTNLVATVLTGGSGATTPYRYVVTSVSDDEVPEESLPTASVSINSYDNKPGANLTWDAEAGADYYNVYKDNNGSGIFGFIGRADGVTFTDNNIAPTKTDTPPNANNPFDAVGDYPGAVGYYQQRLCFAGSDNSPQTMWMSKTGNFNNFGYATPIKDDDSITLTIASRQVHRFRHLVQLQELLGLTTGGEWVFAGADTGLTPKTVQAKVQSYNGSSRIPPIIVNNSAIYVQGRNSVVSSLAYTFESDGFSGEDLTKFSPHFFRGHQLVDWTFQQVPDRLVWAAREDGVLLCMTFLPEEQLIAWHQHVTDGAVESVCSIAEGDEDALYLVIKREVNGSTVRYVERMASRQVSNSIDGYFVDCGLTYDGRNTEPTHQLKLTGGVEWKYPEQLTLEAIGHSSLTGALVGRTISLSVGSDMVRVEVVSVESGTSATVKLTEICPDSLRDVAVADWALMATTLSGLAHLEGKTLSILTDGDVHPQQVVSSGAIALQYPAAVVHAGLPYVAQAETLEIDWADRESSTKLDVRKVVPSLSVILESSRNFWAGRDADHLYEQKPPYREFYNQPLALQTGSSQIKISTAWDEAGRIFIQQADPLPLTVLAVIPEVVTGGKG